MRLSYLVDFVELVALGLLVYSLFFFEGSLRLPVLLLVFGVLVGTGSSWFLNSGLMIDLPDDFKLLFLRVIVIGSIVLLVIAFYLVMVSV